MLTPMCMPHVHAPLPARAGASTQRSNNHTTAPFTPTPAPLSTHPCPPEPIDVSVQAAGVPTEGGAQSWSVTDTGCPRPGNSSQCSKCPQAIKLLCYIQSLRYNLI